MDVIQEFTWPASGLTRKGDESAMRRLRCTEGCAAALA